MKNFSIIVAIDEQNGIGKDNQIPWYLPDDLKNFARITTKTEKAGKQNAVIMGRNTWESLPEKYKPLPNRINVVLSSNPDLDFPEGVLQFDSIDSALTALSTSKKIEQIFIIGGARVYQEAILHDNLERIYLTKIEEDFECDTLFPDEIPEEFEVESVSGPHDYDGLAYSFFIIEKKK